MEDRELMRLASRARERAYAPYSGFAVGAALLGESGQVYLGCNVENASFSATVCAERSALAVAVSAGERRFTAIAVAGAKQGERGAFCPPCGICRQALSEFCGEEFRVLLGTEEEIVAHPLANLLPLSFSAADMEKHG